MAFLETDYFITTWKTTTPNESITIPVNTSQYTYDYDVDWGDNNGVFELGFSTSATHTYTEPGEYTVKIRGVFPHLFFYNRGDKTKILSVQQWGGIVWKSMEYAFFGCANLDVKAFDVPNLSDVKSVKGMFKHCSSLISNISINDWDVGSITDMAELFLGCANFNQDIGKWNVSEVINMTNLFVACVSFNKDLSKWNVSKVKLMGGMFQICTNFNENIGNWDVSNVTTMANMFYRCENFNQDIGAWNVGKVIDMTGMFRDCTVFNQDISKWNTGQVNSMSYMFSECENFNQDISSWDVSRVTSMSSLFRNCKNFNQDIGRWDVSQVTNMSGLFYHCTDFNQDIGSWITSQVTSITSMFNGCVNFNQDIGRWDVSQVTDMSSLFNYCTNFNQDIGSWNVSQVTRMNNMFFRCEAFNQNIGRWDVGQVTSMESTFQSCTSFNQDIGNWDVSQVTNMKRVFSQCANFDQDIGGWNTSKLTNAHQMFSSCVNFNQDIGNWNVSQVTDMESMFSSCRNFNQDIGDWNVGNVLMMKRMFSSCINFNQDIGSWDTSQVTNMEGMFSNCENFNQDLSGWNVGSVLTMRHLFLLCRDFNQDLSGWNVSKVTNMDKIFDLTKLSTENYDALLIEWSKLPLQQRVPFGGDRNITFCRGEIARLKIIQEFKWGVKDGGKDKDCGVFDITKSEITASPNTITADGVEQSVITVQLKDQFGGDITTGGEVVTISTTSGILTGVTDNGDGSYTAFLTTNTVGIGHTIVSFTVNGEEAIDTAAVKFRKITVDVSESSITAIPNTIMADGIEQSVITVQLRNEFGVNINTGGEVVLIETSSGIVTEVTDNGDGTYTAILTSTTGGVATVSFKVNGELSLNTAEVILKPVLFELTDTTKLQSTDLYVQAVGSTGEDGSISGIHLRWLLKGNLGETHLPKGNNATNSNNYNKLDDFVRIYRAPYIPHVLTLDFETLSPSVVDHSNYLWIYRINEVQFYVYFKNIGQYNSIRGSIDPLTDSYDFIQSYGDQLIEIDHKKSLSFAVTLKGVSTSANIKAEVLSVEDKALTAAQYVTARKEFSGEGRIEEENIRTVRYKANHIKQVQFELYSDILTSNTEEKKWEFVGKYALTLDDNEVENRLNSTSIHGAWPRFNDGETVNTENYLDRWNGQETQPYNTNSTTPDYYEYYDRRLKTTVKRYLELSDHINNPTAMEAIPFSPNLPEGVDSQAEDMQDVSNLTMIQFASMDYHLARILGLGHIDTNIDTNERNKKYIYLAEYHTINKNNFLPKEAKAFERDTKTQHIFLSLPTAMVDERLPTPVDLLEPVFGIQNSENENINKLIDEEGYLFDGKQRFISLFNKELPEGKTNTGFFEERTLFSTSQFTSPVYVGIEYKLFDPSNPDASAWRKPELSNTDKYQNFGGINETVPILLPEPNEALFLHREREEGWHRYGSYGINWFSRSQRSTVFWDIETRFSPENRLLPPSNIKACLIVEESPLMLTSSVEQDLLKEITNDDKTLVRLTFDHDINQDGITYQINEESMGTYTDPLDENAIFRDDKEVFTDQVNIFFRNRTPKTVEGKIKSIDSHVNNALAVIRTEGYERASTGDVIFPEILPSEFSHFSGSVFMFKDKQYIIHEINSSTVTGEGPIFTVYKELVSEAMMNGTDPDPTKPLHQPEFENDTIVRFNTVENMLTEANWKVGNSSAINKLDFQITIGDNWPIHREIIDEVSISGIPEQIVEKSRGIWETVIIEEVYRPQENIYDTNGRLIAEPKHVGMYKMTFPNTLDHHPQFNSHNVDWYQGIIRVHTQNNPTKKRKILEVVRIENIGTSDPLVVYAIDPQYPVNIEDVNTVEGFDPILTGSQEINFYPGYRVYLYHDQQYHLTEDAILPDVGEGLKYSIFGLQSVDSDFPENETNPNNWYTSKISQPALFFAQEIIRPQVPLLTNGEEFVYATRPDTFGKSTFTLTPGFKHKPHGVQFYRSNDDAILNALYKPSTVLEIKEKLKEDLDSKLHLVKRWQNLLGFEFEYSETFQTNNEFFLYPEDETGYRFPYPDKFQLYKSINNILEYRNQNYNTNYSLLDLGNPDDETDNGVIGKISLTEVVIPKLVSEGIEDEVTFKDFIKSEIHNAFIPLTEIPLMYEYIRSSDYQPIPKKQVIRDRSGNLLPPTSPEFDMAPMAKRMSQEFIKDISGAKTRILFTDFNLDGTSENLYFYAIREMGSTMQLGDFSPILGPIKLVNTRPLKSPDVRRILPVLQNRILNIKSGISVEINAYPRNQNVKQIKLYRTLNPKEALSVRTMDLVQTIDLEESNQLDNNIWKCKDEFQDLGYIPYGDPLYYRVVALREIEYAEGSNTVKENHPKVIEYVPSEQSKLLISSIVENINPESPTVKYNFDIDSTNDSEIHYVILKWSKTVHNGKYHVYKMNAQGNWYKIHTLISNLEGIQLLLEDTSQEGSLSIKNETGDLKYHHFKVISENSAGMMSTEEKILTIPSTNNIAEDEGIGDMVIENTNIVR
ncbi:BspA family leucine-rich repeat surface protein [Tenacibaculum agarivorans]|uniref:BspA family leucine-rich repeat surface protein n=1 Tax=Tenacibaculum agarivorans TaxID=1908389 RepID=UPI000AE099C0|nr:BspA family leucine-rich repeat surface protein [Tenacibaculum agarivorans]